MSCDIDTAFTALYEQSWRRVWAHIIANCSSTHDAADIFQETWLELYRIMARRGVDYIKNGEAMVMRLASQKLFRHYSLAQKLRALLPLAQVSNEDGSEIEIDDEALTSLSAEELAIDRLNLEAVRKFLEAQDEEIRRIFMLRFQLELSVNEIAELLGISRVRVKNRLYRTLDELKRRLN